ncbi:hypothetical protein MD484_g2834, partial [Candolleomyces efflorescens]
MTRYSVSLASSEDPREKRNAQTVLNLLHNRRHWVLVVLLLSNVIVNESLPIFLDNAIGGGVAAIFISTAAIVIFGIIPQAISVRYGLGIGASCAPLVIALMYIMDLALGCDERHTYKKAELKSLLQFHRTGAEPLREDEISILNGVLELGSKRIESIMTPLKNAMCLSMDTILDQATFDAIQTGRAHLLLISRTPGQEGGALGVVTLEDIIEEMITEEIIDETDRFSDNQCKVTVSRTPSEFHLNHIVERSCDETSSLLACSISSETSKTYGSP